MILIRSFDVNVRDVKPHRERIEKYEDRFGRCLLGFYLVPSVLCKALFKIRRLTSNIFVTSEP